MSAAALKREIGMALGISGAQAVDFWRIAAAAAPAGATAFDPKFSGGVFVATPRAAAGHVVAGHKFTLERHFDADLIRCVLAAADGNAAAARAQAMWAKLRPKIQQLPPATRSALARELSSALQQGGRQP